VETSTGELGSVPISKQKTFNPKYGSGAVCFLREFDPREIPRPAGDNAGLRDDPVLMIAVSIIELPTTQSSPRKSQSAQRKTEIRTLPALWWHRLETGRSSHADKHLQVNIDSCKT
jgi:hypothetical protein